MDEKPTDAGQELLKAAKWYFSPYLTTILTAPMFLVLLGLGILIVIRTITLTFSAFAVSPICGPTAFPVMGGAMFALYYGAISIPKIWENRRMAVPVRVLAIAGTYVGTLVAVYLLDLLQSYLLVLFYQFSGF